jgi:hypothetical protein
LMDSSVRVWFTLQRCQYLDCTASNSSMAHEWERMWKEAAVPYSRHCLGIRLERLKKATESRDNNNRKDG